jgi:ABC-type nitrate/sulfonate/bicarbonate transport system substrate-binding protein
MRRGFCAGRAALRVAGVPEHFNTPFHYARERGLYEQQGGFSVDWTFHPGGTGAMAIALEEDTADVAVMLSEGAVAKIANGSPSMIVGTYVSSPLTWGVHVAHGSPLQSVEDLKGRVFGVSRLGSGSHLMAYVMGHQLGWNIRGGDCPLEVVGSLESAQEAMSDNRIEAFMWEKFTTKHLVDNGEWRRIGEVPTPWPCFVFVASNKALKERANDISALIGITRQMCEEVKMNENDVSVDYVSKHHRMSVHDARVWLDSTEWSCASEVNLSTLRKTSEFLEILGQIPAVPLPADLVAPGCAVIQD